MTIQTKPDVTTETIKAPRPRRIEGPDAALFQHYRDYVRAEDRAIDLETAAEQRLWKLRETWPADENSPEYTALYAAAGLPEMDAKSEAQRMREAEAFQRFIDTRAATLDGVLLRIEFVLGCGGALGGYDAAALIAARDDLRRMIKEAGAAGAGRAA